MSQIDYEECDKLLTFNLYDAAFLFLDLYPDHEIMAVDSTESTPETREKINSLVRDFAHLRSDNPQASSDELHRVELEKLARKLGYRPPFLFPEYRKNRVPRKNSSGDKSEKNIIPPKLSKSRPKKASVKALIDAVKGLARDDKKIPQRLEEMTRHELLQLVSDLLKEVKIDPCRWGTTGPLIGRLGDKARDRSLVKPMLKEICELRSKGSIRFEN